MSWTDCHLHVFGPADRFPFAAERAYTPPDATIEDLWNTLRPNGVGRAVLVQPSVYGSDNRCLLAGLAASGGAARGIVVLDADAPDDDLAAMDRAGVVGVRLNLVTMGQADPARARNLIRAVAGRIAPLGWHLQLFIAAEALPSVAPVLSGTGVDVVFDHMGFVRQDAAGAQPGLDDLLRLLAGGRTFVKLSGPYHLGSEPFGDATTDDLARLLASAAPDRVVWGSDWPHVGRNPRTPGLEAPVVPFRRIPYQGLLERLARWIPDADARQQALVDIPARLYRF